METQTSTRNLVNLVLKGVALAMGVAVVVLNTLGTLTVNTQASLLGIAIVALAIASFQIGKNRISKSTDFAD